MEVMNTIYQFLSEYSSVKQRYTNPLISFEVEILGKETMFFDWLSY